MTKKFINSSYNSLYKFITNTANLPWEIFHVRNQLATFKRWDGKYENF